MKIRNRITEIATALTPLRHELHQHPQIGYEETFAHENITGRLREWNVPYDVMAVTGVVARIDGKRNDSGRAITLRVDMDALKMPGGEESGVPWSSLYHDRMHACGHDGHTVIGLTTARYLSLTRNFNGTVFLDFQPAEERMGGAQRMIAEGFFEKYKMDAIYALHNWPYLPLGTIAVHPGAVMAGSGYYDVYIIGRSGHAGQPDRAIDAGRIMREIGVSFDQMADGLCAANMSRKFRSAVISTTAMHAGQEGVYTRLPGEAHLLGTVRCFDPDIRQHIEDEMNRIVLAQAQKTGASIRLDFKQGSAATINNGEEAAISARVAQEMLGADKVFLDLPPESTAEDFGWKLSKMRGSFIWLGQATGNPKNPCDQALHNERYGYNDDATRIGAEYFVRMVEAKLAL